MTYDIAAATCLLVVNVSLIGYLLFKVARLVDWKSVTVKLTTYCKSCPRAGRANLSASSSQHGPEGGPFEHVPLGSAGGRWPKGTCGAFIMQLPALVVAGQGLA